MRFTIGVTATRDGLSIPQKRFAARHFMDISDGTPDLNRLELHHGDCEGGDADLHHIGRALGGFWIVGHPPVVSMYRAWTLCDVLLPEKPYLDRNHDIVDSVEYMLGFPGTFTEQLRSGTWATIRYARKVGRRGLIVFPDGRWEQL